MLRDHTPADSTEFTKPSASCSTYGEKRLNQKLFSRSLILLVYIGVAAGGLWAQTAGTIRGTGHGIRDAALGDRRV